MMKRARCRPLSGLQPDVPRGRAHRPASLSARGFDRGASSLPLFFHFPTRSSRPDKASSEPGTFSPFSPPLPRRREKFSRSPYGGTAEGNDSWIMEFKRWNAVICYMYLTNGFTCWAGTEPRASEPNGLYTKEKAIWEIDGIIWSWLMDFISPGSCYWGDLCVCLLW